MGPLREIWQAGASFRRLPLASFIAVWPEGDGRRFFEIVEWEKQVSFSIDQYQRNEGGFSWQNIC